MTSAFYWSRARGKCNSTLVVRSAHAICPPRSSLLTTASGVCMWVCADTSKHTGAVTEPRPELVNTEVCGSEDISIFWTGLSFYTNCFCRGYKIPIDFPFFVDFTGKCVSCWSVVSFGGFICYFPLFLFYFEKRKEKDQIEENLFVLLKGTVHTTFHSEQFWCYGFSPRSLTIKSMYNRLAYMSYHCKAIE